MSGEKSPGAGNSNSLHRVNISQTPEVVKQNALEDKVILLQDELTLYPKGKTAQVTLTNSYIKIAAKSKKPYYIFLNEVVGCQLVEGNQTTSAKHYFCIFYYPIKKKVFGQNSRHRCSRSLGVQTHSSSEENLAEALIWRLAIKMIVDGKHLLSSHIDQLRSGELSEKDLQKRRYLVCVNPFSGSGKAKQMYKKNVRKLLSEAEITHELFKTERRGHAHDRMKSENLSNFDAIVIVSGDGLVHEIINGIMKRDDWREAIRTPIGIVPGGSGNALAAAIAYASFGKKKTTNTALLFECLLVLGQPANMRDLSIMSVDQDGDAAGGDPSKHRSYSFLNIGWGFVADVDIESERYRFLGLMRFKVGCFVRVVNVRKYKGVISYIPCHSSNFKSINPIAGDQTEVSLSKDSEQFAADNPAVTSDDDKAKLLERNRHGAGAVPPNGDVREWVKLEDDFIFVMPVYLSHIGGDMFVMPEACIEQPIIYLYCLRYGVSRITLIKALLAFENGKQIETGGEHVFVAPCKAVRIEPLSKHGPGYLTMDGETLDYRSLTVSTTPVFGRVLCRP